MKQLKPRGKPTPPKASPYEFMNEVRKLISGMPHVLIIKDDRKVRCLHCYDDLEHAADPKCPYCLGTGWIPTIVKARCYHQSAERGQAQPKQIDLLEPVKVAIDNEFFYFLPEVGVEVGHFVVVYHTDTNGNMTLGDMQFYEVNHSDLKFDERGRSIIYKVACERDPIDARARTMAIYNLRSTIVEIPVYPS